MDDFTALYRNSRRSRAPTAPAIRMEVRAGKRSFLGSGRYFVYGDGKRIFTARRTRELLPYLEWGINARVIATRADYLQVHSAAMVRSGQGFLFVGNSGAGKSTIVAGLLSRGWGYLSDEFGLIEPETKYAHPFPKAVCIKAGAFELVKRLNLPLWRRRHYVKALKGQVGYIKPADVGPQALAGPSPIRFVIFPKYAGGVQPRLYRISRAQAAFALAGAALNRHEFGRRTVSLLGEIVRGAECLGLKSGRIDDTCDLIEGLLADHR